MSEPTSDSGPEGEARPRKSKPLRARPAAGDRARAPRAKQPPPPEPLDDSPDPELEERVRVGVPTGTRALALLVDWGLVVLAAALPFALALVALFSFRPWGLFLAGALAVLPALLALQWGLLLSRGTTAGKLLRGLRIVGKDRQPLSGWSLFVRHLLRPAGPLMGRALEDDRFWHDVVAGTDVVPAPEERAPGWARVVAGGLVAGATLLVLGTVVRGLSPATAADVVAAWDRPPSTKPAREALRAAEDALGVEALPLVLARVDDHPQRALRVLGRLAGRDPDRVAAEYPAFEGRFRRLCQDSFPGAEESQLLAAVAARRPEALRLALEQVRSFHDSSPGAEAALRGLEREHLPAALSICPDLPPPAEARLLGHLLDVAPGERALHDRLVIAVARWLDAIEAGPAQGTLASQAVQDALAALPPDRPELPALWQRLLASPDFLLRRRAQDRARSLPPAERLRFLTGVHPDDHHEVLATTRVTARTLGDEQRAGLGLELLREEGQLSREMAVILLGEAEPSALARVAAERGQDPFLALIPAVATDHGEVLRLLQRCEAQLGDRHLALVLERASGSRAHEILWSLRRVNGRQAALDALHAPTQVVRANAARWLCMHLEHAPAAEHQRILAVLETLKDQLPADLRDDVERALERARR